MRKGILNLSFFNTKNVLITGSNGYIGSAVAKALLKTSCKLKLFTRNDGNIQNQKIWKNLLKDTHILYHFAAQTSSLVASNNPYEDFNSNVLPIIHILETCKKYNYNPIIIFSGTATEFGYTKKGPISEKYPDSPTTVYDIHKLAAEKYLQYYSLEHGIKSVTLRLPNIYGPGPISSKPDRGIVNHMIKKALHGESLTIYGSGNYMRDYLYIDDTVNAFLASCINIRNTAGQYYAIGTGVGHTFKDMVQLIRQYVSKVKQNKVHISYAPFPPKTSIIEYRQFVANPKKFKKDTGWTARISLKEGIYKTIQYYL